MIHVEDGRVDGVLVLLFFFFKVGEGGAVGDGAFAGGGVGGEEHRVGEGGFAAAAVAGEQDIADVSGSVGGHDWAPVRNAVRRQKGSKYGREVGEGARGF